MAKLDFDTLLDKPKVVSVKVPTSLYEKLRDIAHKERKPLSTLIREAAEKEYGLP